MASTPKPPLSEASPSAESAPAEGRLRAWLIEYGPALRRYFQRRANPADAEDLVQDVFVRLHQYESPAEIANVEGYIFRTAANVLARRAEKPRWRWGSQVPLEYLPDLSDELSPERIVMGRQAVEMVLRGLDDLPPRAAHAFFLYRFEQLSQQAVAHRMGVSLKAVEKFLRRATLQLMDQVGPHL
jgi:RNA polymerase sigma-70 factor (ECF subfamily)